MSEKKGYIILHRGKILLECGESGVWRIPSALPAGIKCLAEDEWFTVGAYRAPIVVDDYEAEAPLQWYGLRESWQLLTEEQYQLAAKASELIYWRGDNLYCGRCGRPTLRATEISRVCESCGREIFPSPSPAVLVLVTRGEEALLVHARTFSRPFFGLVAGFVETGESMEACVAREVKEETSLDVTDICYYGSQAWPYPFNLMVGFTARYAGGEIAFADDELSEGGFFRRDNHPALPGLPSLARKMIDSWINKEIGYETM